MSDEERKRRMATPRANQYPHLRMQMAYHNHSISDLAKRICCNETTLRSWLSGKTSMDVYFAVEISKVYERSVDYLFWRETA